MFEHPGASALNYEPSWSRTKGRQCFQRRGAETPRKMPFEPQSIRSCSGIDRGPQHLGPPDREQVFEQPASGASALNYEPSWSRTKGRQCFQRRGAETPRKMPFEPQSIRTCSGIDRGPQHLGPRIVNKCLSTRRPGASALNYEPSWSRTKGRQCFQRRGAETPRKMPFEPQYIRTCSGIDRGPQHLGPRIVNKCLSTQASRRLGVELRALTVPHERAAVFSTPGRRDAAENAI